MATLLKNFCRSASRFYNVRHIHNFENEKRIFSVFSRKDLLILQNASNVCHKRYMCATLSAETLKELEDIKRLLKNQLELTKNQNKIKGGDNKKQLTLIDLLIQKRVNNLSFSELQQSVSNVDPESMYDLASKIISLQTKFGEEAIYLAAPLLQIASLYGNKNAKYSYAQLLTRGIGGVEQNNEEASSMFSELAEEGHAYAQFSLARMYYSGIGVDQDFKASISLYKVAAENGVYQGFNSAGKMYINGDGVEKDYGKAIECFQKGAEKGDLQCYMSMAMCYSQGYGVEKNYEQAFSYHGEAATRGYIPAVYNIGTHYFSGKGTSVDYVKAAECFKIAADQGFTLAEINLGNMYYNGIGIEKSLEKAKEYYKRAAPKHQNAKLLLEELEMEKNKMEEKKE